MCASCGSNPRLRGIVHALLTEILGHPQVLATMPKDLPISGIGMSDAECYASRLEEVFAY